QRLDDREVLGRRAGAAAAPYAGGVDQCVASPGALERHLDRVARRPGLIESDHALLADQRVDQRRFADIRPADDGDARVALFGLVWLGVRRQWGKDRLEQLAHALAVRRRDRGRRAEAE